MLNLGAQIGRQHAHDVVYDAAQAAFVETRSFADLLAADPRVDRASRPERDCSPARPDRLHRPLRRDGPRRRLPRPRHCRG